MNAASICAILIKDANLNLKYMVNLMIPYNVLLSNLQKLSREVHLVISEWVHSFFIDLGTIDNKLGNGDTSEIKE